MRMPILLAFLVWSMTSFAFATDPRSDTFDITHVHIELDISDLPSKSIQGWTTLDVHLLKGTPSQLRLDLLELVVDSVMINGTLRSHTYNDTILSISLPPWNVGDTAEVKVWYHGQPQIDNSGWGGFYFQGNYAYNLGVGFDADPHNYGRVWYPCFDNFTEKSTLSFGITTDSADRAFCNGWPTDTTALGGKTRWGWFMKDPIPSYLVSVAVADYALIQWTHAGVQGAIPVWLAARAADTSKVRQSFVHLDEAIQAFEESYGPHGFERVGYCMVPFNAGAMEHATNIAYPVSAADGTTQRETLMAHELAHHWFGDLVTCETAEDMWLNEGWASYSEARFLEFVYGRKAYKDYVRSNHANVVLNAHITDMGYLPVSGVSHSVTYGSHVYNKGASVAHTLRAYLGDSAFFTCLTSFMQDHKYGNANSEDFKTSLSLCSGIDLQPFFDGWVYGTGFTHFSLDSFDVAHTADGWLVTNYVRQRLNHAAQLFEDVPLELTYYGSSGEQLTERFLFNGACGIWHTLLPFDPIYVALDHEERLADATIDEFHDFVAGEAYDFAPSGMHVTMGTMTADTTRLRVIWNQVRPDGFRQPISGHHISDAHWWTVEGPYNDADISAQGRIRVDGTTGRRDQNLMTNSEDSLVLWFRSDRSVDWQEHADYQINTLGPPTNKVALIQINSLHQGDYALGILDRNRPDTGQSYQHVSCSALNSRVENVLRSEYFQVHPNPLKDEMHIRLHQASDTWNVRVYAANGSVVHHSAGAGRETSISTMRWTPGYYWVQLYGAGMQATAVQVVVL